MASAGEIYRNYTSTDTTSQGLASSPLPQPPTSWEREGYFFKEWNTSRDGSGTSLQPGDGIPPAGVVYAIWYGDYIEAVKDSSGIEHPIKDIISGYITSSDIPITIIEGTLNLVGSAITGITLTNITYSNIHNILSSGKTIIIRVPTFSYGYLIFLITGETYQTTYGLYTVEAEPMVGYANNVFSVGKITGEGESDSDIVVLNITEYKLQEKLTFDGTYNASTNKAATVLTVTNAINALDGGTIGTGSTTKTITSLSQSNGNVSATFSDITFPVTSVNGQTGAVTTAEKFVITATAISDTGYYNLNKTYADIVNAIYDNKYVTIEDMDATYPYTTITSQGIVFGATLLATSNSQLMAVTDGILVAQSDSSTLGIAVHSSTVLPTMSDIPSASSTTPSMDGTAAVGTGTTWARADHVHPTDTSRQATLVSGTNIKTINNESILGSGNISISAGSSDVFIAEYGVTTYADILAAYEAGKAIFCQKIASSSLNNTKIVSILPLAYIGSSDQTASASRKAIFKNMSGNYSLNQTNITSWTVSGVSGQWSSENIETDTSDQGILSINKSGNSTYLYSNTVNGIVKDDGTGVLSAAVAGTDYQAPLVSGTNIKTINNESLLGSGNIDISGGVGALNSTSKLYLVGAENQQSSVTSYSNSNVYATNGVLNAKSFSVDASANIVYNSSAKSIDFTFV